MNRSEFTCFWGGTALESRSGVGRKPYSSFDYSSFVLRITTTNPPRLSTMRNLAGIFLPSRHFGKDTAA